MLYSYAAEQRAILSCVATSRHRWRLSTGSRCCSLSSPVLASNCMLELSNSTFGRSHRLSLSSRARTRPASDEGSAVGFWTAVPRIMSTYLTKLDCSSTLAESTTFQFLIDNFQQVSSRVGGSWSSASFASFASSASCISNRHTPRLEMPVSHRKQRIGPLSNRHKFAFCNFVAFCGAVHSFLTSNLKPLTSRFLIDNDMHSREESSSWKQSTYKTMIANEFHRRTIPHQDNCGESTGVVRRFVAARAVRCDNRAGNSSRGTRRSSLPEMGE